MGSALVTVRWFGIHLMEVEKRCIEPEGGL